MGSSVKGFISDWRGWSAPNRKAGWPLASGREEVVWATWDSRGSWPSQLPTEPVCGPCSSWLRRLQLCLGNLVLSVAPCCLPPARSAPFLEHIHTALSTACHMALTLSSTDPGFSASRSLHRLFPQQERTTPASPPGRCKTQSSSVDFLFGGLPGHCRQSQLLPPWSPTDPSMGTLLSMQCSTYHTGL